MSTHTSHMPTKPRRDSVGSGQPLWKIFLREAVRDPAELCRSLDISTEHVDLKPDFPMIVPGPFCQRIKKGDPMDPLLLQVLPRKAESADRQGFTTDPLAENQHIDSTGLLSKYQGRSLIVTGGACGIACRFCFRRHLPLPGTSLNGNSGDFSPDPELLAARLRARPEIHEVILSGGDPLMMNDSKLSDLIRCLDQVPSLRRIRVHTRLPVVIPHRITGDLLNLLGNAKTRSARPRRVVVLHVNHANELDGRVCDAIGDLLNCRCQVLSQTVLLHRVNDSAPVLKALFEQLIDAGVVPYYLHQLDRVAGAAHFEVPAETGCRLMSQLRAELPGYGVPRYVREIPGAPGKVILM